MDKKLTSKTDLKSLSGLMYKVTPLKKQNPYIFD